MNTSPPDRRGEAGYNLVVLIVAITILNILLAASLPLWSTAIRREKEEELIFRGLQYAEALRVFQNRHQGAFPTRLEQLIESQPRCIRQLWKDPMTEDGKWGLIFQGQQNQQPLHPQTPKDPQGGSGGDEGDPGDGGDDADGDGGEPTFGPRKGEEVAVGPIVGVYSKSGKTSIMTFFGKQRYDEWRFTVDILIKRDNVNVGGAGLPGGLELSNRWIGRPSPYLNQTPQLRDGSGPLGAPPQGLGGSRNQPTGSKPPKKP